eukprot:TRINITY_DN4741_c0_g1_i1.p1 TRINITY_DN4741_c0_g1~~TRINITY_DN4741_c0_g1_i1.p1  ORF type:complete len:289 (+),score=70.60 TRINITY_DN4741_c0_g1_i1:58-924(+)
MAMAKFIKCAMPFVLNVHVHGSRPSNMDKEAGQLQVVAQQLEAMLTEDLEEPCDFAKKYDSRWKRPPFEDIQNQISELSTSCNDKAQQEVAVVTLTATIATLAERIPALEQERTAAEQDKTSFIAQHPDRTDEKCAEAKEFLAMGNKVKRGLASAMSDTVSMFGYLGSKVSGKEKQKQYNEKETARKATKREATESAASKEEYWKANCREYDVIVDKISALSSSIDKKTEEKEAADAKLRDAQEELSSDQRSIEAAQMSIPEAIETLKKEVQEMLASGSHTVSANPPE